MTANHVGDLVEVTLIILLAVSHLKTECLWSINISMVMVGRVVYSQMNILGPLLIGSLVLKLLIIGFSVYICEEE